MSRSQFSNLRPSLVLGLTVATLFVWAVVAIVFSGRAAGGSRPESSPDRAAAARMASPTQARPAEITPTPKPAQLQLPSATPAQPSATQAQPTPPPTREPDLRPAQRTSPARSVPVSMDELPATAKDQAACPDGCPPDSAYAASLHQPPAFSKENSLSRLIYEQGFRSLEKERLVTGPKELLQPYPLETKDPAFRYWLPEDYATILAASGRPEEALLSLPDLTPFQIPQANAAQYLDLSLIFGEEATVSKRHFNLCGPVTVMALTGDQPDPFFQRLLEKKSWAGPFLADGNDGVGYSEIAEMLLMQGWRVADPAYDYRSCQVIYGTADSQHYTDQEIAYCQLRRWLDEGLVVFTVANLAVERGVLIPAYSAAAKDQKNVEHWTAILQTIESLDGQQYVRIYNSLHNREEYYLWMDFQRIWLESRGYPVNILAYPQPNTDR